MNQEDEPLREDDPPEIQQAGEFSMEDDNDHKQVEDDNDHKQVEAPPETVLEEGNNGGIDDESDDDKTDHEHEQDKDSDKKNSKKQDDESGETDPEIEQDKKSDEKVEDVQSDPDDSDPEPEPAIKKRGKGLLKNPAGKKGAGKSGKKVGGKSPSGKGTSGGKQQRNPGVGGKHPPSRYSRGGGGGGGDDPPRGGGKTNFFGQQPVSQDIIDVERVTTSFSNTLHPEWSDEGDTIKTLCSFKTMSEEQRNHLKSDGCFIVPIEFCSIKYSAPVKSPKVNYDIQVYGRILKEALQNEIAERRGKGRPPKNQYKPIKNIDYDRYNNISQHRIPLHLYELEGLCIHKNIIYLELFMNIDWDLFGQYTNGSYPGMLVSFKRADGKWYLKCLQISNILNGFKHNPTKHSDLIRGLQEKYVADCTLQKTFDNDVMGKLRIVPFIMNKCVNNPMKCAKDGYVVCSHHGQCVCVSCYNLYVVKEPMNLKTRVLPHPTKGCICDQHSVTWEPQPRINIAHFYFMEDKICQSVQDDFDRLSHHMICPGYTVFDTKQFAKKSMSLKSILKQIRSYITSTFLTDQGYTTRNWISFLSHSDTLLTTGTDLILGDHRSHIPVKSLTEEITQYVTPEFMKYPKKNTSNHELLISFISCFLTHVEWFLNIPQDKNQYVIFLHGMTKDVSFYAKFPTLMQEFWQDRQQNISQAFENTMKILGSCGMTLISFINKTQRLVTEFIDGFKYTTYNRNESGEWVLDDVKTIPRWPTDHKQPTPPITIQQKPSLSTSQQVITKGTIAVTPPPLTPQQQKLIAPPQKSPQSSPQQPPPTLPSLAAKATPQQQRQTSPPTNGTVAVVPQQRQPAISQQTSNGAVAQQQQQPPLTSSQQTNAPVAQQQQPPLTSSQQTNTPVAQQQQQQQSPLTSSQQTNAPVTLRLQQPSEDALLISSQSSNSTDALPVQQSYPTLSNRALHLQQQPKSTTAQQRTNTSILIPTKSEESKANMGPIVIETTAKQRRIKFLEYRRERVRLAKSTQKSLKRPHESLQDHSNDTHLPHFEESKENTGQLVVDIAMDKKIKRSEYRRKQKRLAKSIKKSFKRPHQSLQEQPAIQETTSKKRKMALENSLCESDTS